MVQHAALTGAELHEPKGADSASADEVWVADGLGSGAFQKITTDQLDTTIIDINKRQLLLQVENFTAGSVWLIPFTRNTTVNKITTVISAAITTSDTTLTITKNGISSLGTITVAFTGSAQGDIDSLTPASNNTFVNNDYLRIVVAGGAGTSNMTILIDYTLT